MSLVTSEEVIDLEVHRRLFTTMVRIRRFEEKAVELFRTAVIPGFIHSYIGEEAIAAGVCAGLGPTDYLTSTHRGHGHGLAKGMRMDRMMAEILGRSTGYNRGKGGSMHVADFSSGVIGAMGIVAGGVPLATGAAFSAKIRGTGQVAVAFLGDGAVNRGAFHESVNMAAIWDLPVVYVVEDNSWAISMPRSKAVRLADLSERALGYGILGASVDGTDVLAVYASAKEAIARAREGRGPTLLVCRAGRQRAHDEGDTQPYRTKEDIAAVIAADPIPKFRRFLTGEGLFTDSELDSIDTAAVGEAEQAAAFALNSQQPQPSEALLDVFSGGNGYGRPRS